MFTDGDWPGPKHSVRVHQILFAWAQKLFDLEDIDSSHRYDLSLCYYCKARMDKDAKHRAICGLMKPYLL